MSDQVLLNLIAGGWEQRADRYSQLRQQLTGLPSAKVEMSYIGG